MSRLRPGTPSTAKIIAYWQKEWPSFVDDPEDPGCFACHILTDDEGWPRLQRCHILAHSAGGTQEPSNFLILCEDCHRAAPMTSDRTILIQWVIERPNWLKLFLDMAIDAVRTAGLQPEQLKPVDQASFHAFLRSRHLDFHPHSTRLDKMVAIAYLLREYLEVAK